MNFTNLFDNTILFGDAHHRPMNNCYDNESFISRNSSIYIPSPYHLSLSSDEDEEESNKARLPGSFLYDSNSSNNSSSTSLSEQQNDTLLYSRSESYSTSLSLSPLSPLSPPAPWCNVMDSRLTASPDKDGPVIQDNRSMVHQERDHYDNDRLLVHPFLPSSVAAIGIPNETSPSLEYTSMAVTNNTTGLPPAWVTNTQAIIDRWGNQVLSEMENHTFQQAGKKNDHPKSQLPNLSLDNVSPDEATLHLKKFTHNAIERRYRNNINHRIAELKNVVPALSDMPDDFDGEEDVVIDGVQVAQKTNKATILRKATEYIGVLKNTGASMAKENAILQDLIRQMPGGDVVLAAFKQKKHTLQQAEAKRQAYLRQVAKENERIDHQRLLRERAAHRAELAKLIPKSATGRRPYQKRSPRRARQSAKLQS